MESTTITLYVRTACPLCEETEASLRALIADQTGLMLRIVDIEEDLAQHLRLVAEIPAIEMGDRLLPNARGRLRIAAFLAGAPDNDEPAPEHTVMA